MPLARAKSPPRQGVILLIVVVLLTLFLVVGLSFVLYAESAASASRIYRESQTTLDDRADEDTTKLFNWALGQLIYDVRDDGEDLYSALRGHSIARLTYGWNYANTPPVDTAMGFDPNAYAAPNATLNQIPYNGIGALRVNSFIGRNGPPAARPFFAPYREDQLVNYTSFNKFGDAFTDQFIRDPERIGWRNPQPPPYPVPMTLPYAGGVNVPYTYPDRNNMFLAAVRANGTTSPNVLMPSFFRPFQLGASGPQIDDFDTSSNPKLRYWLETNDTRKSAGSYLNAAAVAYKYLTLRPRPGDMNWNYNNPNDPNNFPLPKDRGGDVTNLPGSQGFKGTPTSPTSDSFWMDLNYPVLTARNGRPYKPLFAFLVVDLEGKVNVNAHGNLRGKDNNNPAQPTHASHQGVGKHEVNLAKVLDDITTTPPEWQNIFRPGGRYGSGTDQAPGIPAESYPARPLDSIGSPLAPLDTDAADDTVAPPNDYRITQRFTFPLPAHRLFPDYRESGRNGHDELATPGSRLQHPLLYNALSPRSDNPFPLKENLHYLHGSVSGTNHFRSQLTALLPKNLGGTTSSRRFMLTTHSYDLDVPGMSACVDTNPYTRADGQPYPKEQSPQVFDTGLDQIRNPSPVSDGYWQFGDPAFAPPPPTPDGRVPLLSRIDLNRKLASYFAGSPLNYDATAALAARNDRQWFAMDIFHRLIQATGANRAAPDPVAGGPWNPETEALRWLAQLAANIVDYIDEDDISTAFDWVAAKNLRRPDGSLGSPYSTIASHYVFGTESPQVLLNEVYAEMRNDPADTNASTTGATMPFHVNFFIELFNPRSPANRTAAFTKDLDQNTAVLQNPTFSTIEKNVYEIRVYEETGNFLNDLRRDITGSIPDPPAPGSYTPKCGLTNFDGIVGGGVDKDVLRPNTGAPPAGTVTNEGFYLVSANADLASGESLTPTLKATGNDTLPGMNRPPQLRYTVQQESTPPAQSPMTVVLRRLANPHQAPQNDPNVTTPPYNPYITVDYQPNVRVHDAVQYGQAPPIPPPQLPGFMAARASQGRAHPFAANRVGDQTGSTQRPAHTFFNNNSNSNNGRYDWVQHLNRPLVNAMELLQVSGYRPHELTQVYSDATGAQKNLHRAPWRQSDARIYRAFEFLTTGERNAVGSSTAALPANATYSTGGRKAGMININTVWDRQVFEALCDAPQTDAPQNSNYFNATDVNAIWTALQARRSTALGGSGGTVDRPFVGLAGPPAQAGDPQFDPTNGNAGSASSHATSVTLTKQGPPDQHPFLTEEVLAKIGAHVTTRSSLFEVYVTVGFFEVIDPSARPVKLGAEIRARDGSFIRHKFFAVVDRTNIGMEEPTAAEPQAIFRQSNGATTKPIYLTSPGPINLGASSFILTAVPDRYDPAYDTLAQIPWSNLAGKYIYVGTGVRRERLLVQSATVSGTQLTIALAAGTPTQYEHPAGTTVTTFRAGNPGPQGGAFDVKDLRFQYVVPYYKVVE